MSLESFSKIVSNNNPNIEFLYNLLEKVTFSRLEEIFQDIDISSLKDPDELFSKKMHNFILLYNATAIGIKKDNTIFRSRKHTEFEDFFSNLSDLKSPPKDRVLISGRLNKTRNPIYYAATNPHIAILETTLESSESEPIGYCTVIGSILHKDNLSKLISLYPEHIKNPIYDDSAEALAFGIKHYEFIKKHLSADLYKKVILLKQYVADRVTANRSNPNFNCYRITSEIANLLFTKFSIIGIIYPTVAMGHSKSCIALLPEIYDSHFRPSDIMRIKYEYFNSPNMCTPNNNVLCSHTHTHSAYKIRQNGRILWKEKSKDEKRVDVIIDSGVPKFINYYANKVYIPKTNKL